MGQYFVVVILGPRESGKHETIRYWLRATYLKLMETSYIGNSFVSAVELLLSNSGCAYKSRIVWAGDYADDEPLLAGDTCKPGNLYTLASDSGAKRVSAASGETRQLRYIVNHDTKQFVDKARCASGVHPLPILACEGNGRGLGDYYGTDGDKVGIWARATLSMEGVIPEGFTELCVNFDE